jgi:hypothetical protein
MAPVEGNSDTMWLANKAALLASAIGVKRGESPVRERLLARNVAYIVFAPGSDEIAFALATALEGFRIPTSIRTDSNFPERRRLRPVFVPDLPLGSGRDIGRKNRFALETSNALIVLCNASSADSNSIDEQIRCFLSVGDPDRIVCVLIDDPGSVNATSAVTFAPAVGERGREPLAADLRSGAEPRQSAVLRIAAALLDCDFESLRQRWRGERIRNRMLVGMVAVGLVLSLAWFLAWSIGATMIAIEAGRAVGVSSHARSSLCELYDDLGRASIRLEAAAQLGPQKSTAIQLRESATRIWLQCAHDEEHWGSVEDYEVLYCPPFWAKVPADLISYVQCPK